MKHDATELVVGEIDAYRAFDVQGSGLWSVGLGEHLWAPGPNRARCHLAGGEPPARTVWVNDPDDPDGLVQRKEAAARAHGRIPSLACTCGFWVFADEWVCRGEFEDTPSIVIAKVKIWGRAIGHKAGYRAEYAKITQLITEHPHRFSSVMKAYNFSATRPRTKAEQGLTTAYLTLVDGDRVKLDVPVRDTDEVIGWFGVAPGVEIPDPVVRVSARFTPDRVITELRPEADDA